VKIGGDSVFGLSALAVRRPVATLMALGIVITVGLVSAARLPVDLLPEFELHSVTVFAPYPGVGSEEVESLVLEPLERAVAAVPGIKEMTGTAREGAAVVYMRLDEDADLIEAMNDVRVAVERTRGRLPDDLESPQVFRFDPNQFPIVFFGVSGDVELRELTRLVRDVISPRLSRVPGVASVDIRGAFEREVRVELSAAKMIDLQVPIDDVARALVAENVDLSVGKVEDGGLEVGLRTVASKTVATELLDIPVAVRVNEAGQERVIRVRDVAAVVDSEQEPNSVVRERGRPALRVGVRKGPGENTIEVAARAKAAAAELDADLPGVSITVFTDQSKFIQSAVSGAERAAVFGGLLAIAVLLLFLRSFRATLLIAIAIPSSVLVSFFVMDRAGVSLNLMTLGGVALGVGMLVDNAVVVLESIVHHRAHGSGKDAAVKGASEVALAVAASTATTVVIFAPVLFLTGINRVIYGQLALVVTAALVASLIISLTVVPALSGALFRAQVSFEEGPVMSRVSAAYRALLRACLGRPLSTLAILVGVALLALALVPRVKTELMPAADQGEVRLNIDLPIGTPIEETDRIARDVAAVVEKAVPEAARVGYTAGSPGWWSSRTGDTARVNVVLPERGARPRPTSEVVEAINKALPKIPGAKIGVRPGGGLWLLRFLRGGSGEDRLELEVRGTDLDAMQKWANEAADLLEKVPGVADVRKPRLRGRDEVVVEVDAEKAALYGLSAERLGTDLETYVRGRRVSRLRTTVEEVPVILRLAEEDRAHVGQIARLLVRAPRTGEPVPVGELATLTPRKGPMVIRHSEGQRTLSIGAEVAGRPLGEAVKDVRAAIAELPAPEGVQPILSGEASSAADMFSALTLGAMLALLLVYMVMAAQFESLIQPLLIMVAVPFGGVGVLVLFGAQLSTLNIYSFMGMIVLVGIAVNNAIVLVDYAGQLRRQGMTPRQAMTAAAERRLRPILMTTCTTLLGLLPVAISTADGAELQGPLARVVVAGLLTATMGTLVLVPVLYVLALDVVAGRLRR
jgi:HAE1 family hydrophobic/amphiphilic exporter-1